MNTSTRIKAVSTLGLLLLVVAAARAQVAATGPDAGIPQLRKVETTKVCQLTGERDEAAGRPTVNETWTRFRLGGTDLGASFMHEGTLWFLFGDSMPTGPNENDGVNHACGDAIAYATASQASTCPQLNFSTHPGTTVFRSPVVPGVDLGCFNVPAEGISIEGAMYVWFTTGTMTRSLLSRSDDAGQTFTQTYAFSDRHFINVSAERSTPSPGAGLPDEGDDWVMLFGSGQYRQSAVYLAAVPANRIEEKAAIRYFAGVDPATGRPRWRADEMEAQPLSSPAPPCVGELSAHFDETRRLWMLLYNCDDPRGIHLQAAAQPWGPWSTPQVIFHPWQDDGYCHFIHKACTPAQGDCCDDLAPPGHEGTWGGEYGPYVIEPLTEVDALSGQVTLYYVLSTWIPYNTVVMRTVLETGTSTSSLDGDGDVPQDFVLHQNHPNPFNPATVIRYALPQAGPVRLVVYDVGGREVMTLVDRQQAPGTYAVDLDATSLPSGVYVYRLEANGFVDARSMLLVK